MPVDLSLEDILRIWDALMTFAQQMNDSSTEFLTRSGFACEQNRRGARTE